MSTPAGSVYTVSIDGFWRALPATDEDAAAAIDTMVEGFAVDPQAAERLRHGLTAVTTLARSLAPGERRSYALVRDPGNGAVEALLSTRVSRVSTTAVDDYRARIAEGRRQDDIDIVNRTVEERDLPQGHALVVHDITLREDGEGLIEPALERTILALFVHDSDVLIEFYLATQDLALFDDMVGYLVDLVAGRDQSEGFAK